MPHINIEGSEAREEAREAALAGRDELEREGVPVGR
jgi:hypothetical protein